MAVAAMTKQNFLFWPITFVMPFQSLALTAVVTFPDFRFHLSIDQLMGALFRHLKTISDLLICESRLF